MQCLRTIQAVTSKETLAILKQQGYTHLVLQIGAGQEPSIEAAAVSSSAAVSPSKNDAINVTWYRYKDSLKSDVENASLVISHAGN